MAVSEGGVRRIIDYLNEGEELGVEGAVGTPPWSPSAAAARLSLPRFRWPRLSRLGKKAGCGKEKTVLEEEEEIVAEKSEQATVAESTSVEQEPRECEPATTSGTRNSDLGVGLSLVFLLAKTSDEFNKMVKVRAEMEALLKEMKHQLKGASGGNGHGVPELRKRESTTSSCVTDGDEQRVSAQRQDQASSSGALAASCEKSSEDDDDDSCARTDVLEDEFHAELERLQCTYGSDIPLFGVEDDDLDSEPSDEIDDYRNEGDDELGEVAEDEKLIDDDDETEYNGVSAVELERRLHELLHQRNRERIEELEAALRRAERKLAEKDMEVCLWKDTAKFALRQENELQ